VTLGKEGLAIKDGPSVKKDGIDAGNKKITNVADGENDTDAVNYKQLKEVVNGGGQAVSILGNKVSALGNRVNRVGAGAAALAALHPLDFDPDDKWDFAAGYGRYKGANAAAVGAYYRPNEDTMISVGGSFGGGENMMNAGVSLKLGQGNHVTTSRVAMAKEIKDLRAEVEMLRSAIAGIGEGQAPDPVKMKLFPDVAKNHWAYEAVGELAKQGLLEGYPDGTFGGDRMMTRYEFAALVYRAVQKGLNVNEKLISEFEPELERFRIDVISRDKAGNPAIERVRVNQKAEPANA
ncbi:MAG: S-layer homology domain-containing protein, partial [Dialister sp.]|nr:S-layer homology domain-containing protein [Dialister sp.]